MPEMDKNGYHFTSPCHILLVKSDTPTYVTWFITVHKTLIVNVTVIKAYVSYTDTCSSHSVAVWEGHSFTEYASHEKFCGHILLESSYTKSYKGAVSVYASSTIQFTTVEVLASYQVHTSGYAYRFNSHMFALCYGNGNAWLHRFNRKPSWTLHVNKNYVMVWYIANGFAHIPLHFDKGRRDVEQPFSAMILTFVHIKQFKCISNKSDITIYAGLVPFQWTIWRNNPYTKVMCNNSTQNTHHFRLDYHRYVTIVLTLNHLDTHSNVSIKFQIAQAHTQTYFLHEPMTYVGSSSEYWPDYPKFYQYIFGNWRTITWTTKFTIMFTQFEVTDVHYNVKAGLVHEIQTHYRRYINVGLHKGR
jgi:ribosomal protein S19